MKSKNKFLTRMLSGFVSFTVAAGMLSGTTVLAQSNRISTSETTVLAGAEASIPIEISGNTGIAGFGIYITYDPDVITPVDVDDSQGLIAGCTENSIGGTLASLPENTVKVMYSQAENMSEDGLLFDFVCSIDAQAVGSTTLQISYEQGDTINADIEDVVLSCQDITLEIQNDAYDAMPALVLSANHAMAGEAVTVEAVLSNKGSLSAAEFSISYDAENFTYRDITAAENVMCNPIQNENGTFSFALDGLSLAEEGSVLFSLTFESSDTADAGTYNFTGISDAVSGADDIHIVGCRSVISPSETSDSARIFSDDRVTADYGETLTVPVYISNNKGITGYKLIFNYDSSYMTPADVTDAGLFPGTFNCNLDKENQVVILWNHSDNVYENGHIFDLVFTVNTEETVDTEIIADYSQPDTFVHDDEEGIDYDVTMICSNIAVSLNEAVTTTTSAETTAVQTTTTTTSVTTAEETTASSDESTSAAQETTTISSESSASETTTSLTTSSSSDTVITTIQTTTAASAATSTAASTTISTVSVITTTAASDSSVTSAGPTTESTTATTVTTTAADTKPTSTTSLTETTTAATGSSGITTSAAVTTSGRSDTVTTTIETTTAASVTVSTVSTTATTSTSDFGVTSAGPTTMSTTGTTITTTAATTEPTRTTAASASAPVIETTVTAVTTATTVTTSVSETVTTVSTAATTTASSFSVTSTESTTSATAATTTTSDAVTTDTVDSTVTTSASASTTSRTTMTTASVTQSETTAATETATSESTTSVSAETTTKNTTATTTATTTVTTGSQTLRTVAVSGTHTVTAGEMLQLVLPEDTEAEGSLVWSSEDAETATIDEKGVVSILKEGTVTIIATDENGTAYEVTLTTEEIKKPSVLRGDANCDGSVDIEDATLVLKYYANHAAGFLDYTFCEDPVLEEVLLEAVDINLDDDINITDATLILSYYARNAAGLPVEWDDLI
ncbi:MAG: hypothetical protein IJ512_06050 [Ruminococcus sp.]|nr:hypothetical protein [Ruminococcus sp.]